MSKRRVSRRTRSRRDLGSSPGTGRGGAVSGLVGQAASGDGIDERGLFGPDFDPADVIEAPADQPLPQIVPKPDPAPHPQPSHQPARIVRTSDLTPPANVPKPLAPPKRTPDPEPDVTTEAGPCPACDNAYSRELFESTDVLYATTTRRFQVVECVQCRLIRLSPWPTPSELRHYYPETYWFAAGNGTAARLEESYRRFVLADHVRFVRRAVENGGEAGPVLDVGCGGGLFLRMLAERGIPVVGLDFSLDAASVAWHGNRVPAMCATLTRAPIQPGSCAAITMFHVLEHLYDPGAYLDAAHELLKPNGRLVIQVPNAACWQFLLFGDRWNGIDVPRHLINFKESDIVGLLEACGFEIVHRKHFSWRDNPAGLATTLAPSLDPMARRVRRIKDSPGLKLFKDIVYLGLVFASIPFTIIEATCYAGSTIMIEARKKA